MNKPSILHIGGSIERALKGDYHIDVKTVLNQAWQLTLSSRVAINLGLAFVLILGMTVSYVVSSYFGGVEEVFNNPEASMLLNIVATLVIWPFLAGVEMMGVFHAINMKTQPQLIFAFLKRGSWVALCALLTSLFISIGFQLFILPGIFLAVVLSLTIPLIVEKKMTPMRAIILSIQTLRFKFFQILALYAILLGVFVLLMMPALMLVQYDLMVVGVVFFLFGFSYLAPMFYNVKGILYRDIFGLDIADSGNRDKDNNEDDSNDDNGESEGNNTNTKSDNGSASDDIFTA